MAKFVVIQRDQHSRDFTILSNHVIRDSNISYHARFLMSWLLSFNPKDDFKYTLEMIARKINMPLTRVRTCVQELQDAGYITLKRTRDGARFGNYIWYLYETPIKSAAQEPNIQEIKEDEPPVDDIAEVIPISEYNFNRIWEAYPADKRSDRKAAMKAYKQIPNADDIIEDILIGLQEMKGTQNWIKDDGQWIPGLPKFLSYRIWEKGLDNPTSAAARKEKMMEALRNAGY